MKRARFIAPVEVLQGNLSGKQDLMYPSNDNKAYEAPIGVNYARNYTTRYIGAYRARDGLKYFNVKRRSATKISASSKLNMALLGATQAIWANIKSDQTLMGKINVSHGRAVELGLTDKSLENWVKDIIRQGLLTKAQYLTFPPQTSAGVGVATNPFNAPAVPQSGAHVTSIKNSVLVEFWGMLSVNGIYIYIGGRKCIGRAGMTFDQLRQSGLDQVMLGVSTEDKMYAYIQDGSQGAEPTAFGYQVLNGDVQVINTDVLVADQKYALGAYEEFPAE